MKILIFSFLFFQQALAQTCKPSVFEKLKFSARAIVTSVIDKQIDEKIPATNIMGLQQREVLKLFPELAIIGHEEGCKALILSYTICDAYSTATSWEDLFDQTNDEETDAIRHFILTALIARRAGVQKTKFLMNAHEAVDPDLGLVEALKATTYERDKMDLYNNFLSLAWVSSQGKKQISDKDIVEQALLFLKQGKFSKLRIGNLSCAKTDFRKNYQEIEKNYQENLSKFKTAHELCTENKAIIKIYNFFDILRKKQTP